MRGRSLSDRGALDSPSLPRTDLSLATALFVLSGAAALVYQVAWQRLLALSTGVSVHSVAIITAAFMAGLGIGSHAGGALSRKRSPRGALIAFAVVELLVAAFAAGSVPFFYHALYVRAPWLYDGIVRASLVHFLSLLPPTALMGMSLPLLVQGLVRERAAAPSTIGVLYGANALGAALGALLTPWILLRFLGVEGAVLLGAGGSTIAALGGLLLARRAPSVLPHTSEAETAGPVASSDEPPSPFPHWTLLYAVSGFVALSLEMVWFRVLVVAAKDAAFTFGTLLSVYLLGLASGSLVGARRAAAIRRPLALYLTCQIGTVLATVLAHVVLAWIPSHWPIAAWLIDYGQTAYGVQMHAHAFRLGAFLIVYVGIPLFLFGPSTFLMGLSFTVLQRATQADPAVSGQRVGFLQSANIAGCTLGSLVTGLLLFDALGTAGIFRLLTVVAFLLAVFGAVRLAQARRRMAALAAAALVAAVAFPWPDRLWARLHGGPPVPGARFEEDAASLTALAPVDKSYKLTINGRFNSWLPYGWLHTVVGALPAVLHSNPVDVAVVGLGSGDTAWAASCRPESQRVVVFEIASSQPKLLARVADEPRMIRLKQFLTDPRVTIVTDDGRRRLKADGRKYDVIVADAIDTDTSMSNNVYSVEFYAIVKDALKPGGMICVLAKTPRIRAAIEATFPHTLLFGREDLVVASPAPLPLDLEPSRLRLTSGPLVEHFGKARVRTIADFLRQATPGRPLPPTVDPNRDLDPKDEFVRPLRAAGLPSLYPSTGTLRPESDPASP